MMTQASHPPGKEEDEEEDLEGIELGPWLSSNKLYRLPPA